MTRPARVLHAADLHLGASFIGASLADSERGRMLREAVETAFVHLVDLALNENVDAVVLAGDVFNAEDDNYAAQEKLRAGMLRLAEAGIDVAIATGNHDPLDGRPRLTLPDNVHLFSAEHVEVLRIEHEGVEPFCLIGRSYARAEENTDFVPGYRAAVPADCANTVGVLHTNVGTANSDERYARCTLADLKDAGIAYWALGHIHLTAVLNERTPTIIYAGSPQAMHINDRGTHGCYLVALHNGTATYAYRRLGTIEFVHTELAVDDLTDEPALIDALGEVCLAQASDDVAVIVRVRLTGERVDALPLEPADRERIVNAVQRRLRGADRNVALDGKLIDATVTQSTVTLTDDGNPFLADLLADEATETMATVRADDQVKSVLSARHRYDPDHAIGNDPTQDEEIVRMAREMLFRRLMKRED